MAKKVQYIKIARIDQNGNDLTNTLESLTQITIPYTTSGNKVYKILTRADFSTYYLFQIDLANTPDAPTNPNTSATTLDYNIIASFQGSNTPYIAQTFSQPPTILPLTTATASGTTTPTLFENFYNSNTQRLEINTMPKKDLHFKSNDFYLTVTRPDLSYAETASVSIFKSNSTFTDNVALVTQNKILSENPLVSNLSISVSKANISPGDIFYVGVQQGDNASFVNGVQFTVTSTDGTGRNPIPFIMTSSAAQGSQLENIVEPYLSKKFINSDCDVLINNADQYQDNPFLQDLDYSTNPLVPVNYNQVVTGTAQKAKVPQSHYTMNNIINPNYNSSNSTPRYNIDNSSYTSQVSAGCFVAYWKTLFSAENVANQKYYAVASLKYLISPDEELLEINSEPEMVGLIRQLYGSNANSISANSGAANFFGEPNIFRNTSISFANTGSNSIGTLLTSDNEASNFTGFSYVVPFAGTVNILLYTSSSFAPTPLGTDSDGGLLFPTDISLTTHATLPARARQILTENNVIPPQK